MGQFTEYYRDALRYLGCIDVDADLTTEERPRYAFDLGLAALLSDEIYNFGELVCNMSGYVSRGVPNNEHNAPERGVGEACVLCSISV